MALTSTVGFRDFRLPFLISAQVLGDLHVFTLLLSRNPQVSTWLWNSSTSWGAWIACTLWALSLHLENGNHTSLQSTASCKVLSLVFAVCWFYSVNFVVFTILYYILSGLYYSSKERGQKTECHIFHLFLFRYSASLLLLSYWWRGWVVVNRSSNSQQVFAVFLSLDVV